MGYTTELDGRLKLNKKLKPKIHDFLKMLEDTRRMKRNLGDEYGIDGEFYPSKKYMDETSVVDTNIPPSTQPSLNLGWVPSEDGMYIEWNGVEKFYYYKEWLVYLISKILEPNGYILNGIIKCYGEDSNDRSIIVVKNNVVKISSGLVVYELDAISAKRYDPANRTYINDFIKPDVVYIIKEDE